MLVFRILTFVFLLSFGSTWAMAQQTLDQPQSDQQKAEDSKSDEQESDQPESAPSEDSSDAAPPKPEADQDDDQSKDDKGGSKEKSDDQKKAEQAKEAADSSTKRPSRVRRGGSRVFSKRNESFIGVFSPAVASTSASVVEITDGKRRTSYGTIVDSDGFILTKASELKGDVQCKLADGTSLKPTIVGIDPDTDLVLLKVKMNGLPAARFSTEFVPEVGSWLASVDQDETPLTVGIVSHAARRIKNVLGNSAVIGIFPEDREGKGVRINRVNSDSPGDKAGLLVNDIIVGIDETTIDDRSQLLEKLSQFRPGDEIELKIRRGEEELNVPVTLGKRRINPMMERGSRQDRMGSTLSKRRSNFPLAVQHDSALNASQCGGPVVDLDGQIVGINIARDGRVSSLALPNEVIVPIVAKLKTGRWAPAVVNEAAIKQIKRELADLEKEMGDLPAEKSEKEIEFSAGNALEKELMRQVKENEERLDALRARLKEQKESNKVIVDSLAEIDAKRQRIEQRREPLEQDLKQLSTGIK